MLVWGGVAERGRSIGGQGHSFPLLEHKAGVELGYFDDFVGIIESHAAHFFIISNILLLLERRSPSLQHLTVGPLQSFFVDYSGKAVFVHWYISHPKIQLKFTWYFIYTKST